MASPQPFWVEKELRTYNSAYRVWFQLGIADHIMITEMFTSETSAYQVLLVILEQAVSLLSFQDLLVRLHLMICFVPFSFKKDNSVKRKKKNHSTVSYQPRTCDWKRTDHCKGVWERWMNVCALESAVMSAVTTVEYAYWRLTVEAGILFSSWFILQDIVLCSLKWTNSYGYFKFSFQTYQDLPQVLTASGD